MLEGKTITHYTEREGLSNNLVQSLVEDGRGHIWISTEKGLNLIEGDTLIRNYGLQDGLKGADFILNSVLTLSPPLVLTREEGIRACVSLTSRDMIPELRRRLEAFRRDHA